MLRTATCKIDYKQYDQYSKLLHLFLCCCSSKRITRTADIQLSGSSRLREAVLGQCPGIKGKRKQQSLLANARQVLDSAA